MFISPGIMLKRGRPRKRQCLFTVKNYVEYTSDSDSDLENIQYKVRYEIKQGSLQSIRRHAELVHKLPDGISEPTSAENVNQDIPTDEEVPMSGEYIPTDEEVQNPNELPDEIYPEQVGESIQTDEEVEMVGDSIQTDEEVEMVGEYIQTDEEVEMVGEYIQTDEEVEMVGETICTESEETDDQNHIDEDADESANEVPDEILQQQTQNFEDADDEHHIDEGDADEPAQEFPDGILQQQPPNDEDDALPDGISDDENHIQQEENNDILENLKSQWLLSEIQHCVSKSASEAFWTLAKQHFPKLDDSKKTPQFKSIRRKMYDDLLPSVDMEIAYRNKTTGEINIVQEEITPRKRFPANEYDKLYEIGTLKVSKRILISSLVYLDSRQTYCYCRIFYIFIYIYMYRAVKFSFAK